MVSPDTALEPQPGQDRLQVCKLDIAVPCAAQNGKQNFFKLTHTKPPLAFTISIAYFSRSYNRKCFHFCSTKACRRVRNSSAAGEKTWYFFQMMSRPDSSRGHSGRKHSALSGEVSARPSRVMA